jgi:hypothetical protein
MAFDTETVIRRDNRVCRFRFTGCRRHATRVVLDVPEFLGGSSSDDNALASCDSCADRQRQQRNRASELFGYNEGW